jgi:hypothetical protein
MLSNSTTCRHGPESLGGELELRVLAKTRAGNWRRCDAAQLGRSKQLLSIGPSSCESELKGQMMLRLLLRPLLRLGAAVLAATLIAVSCTAELAAVESSTGQNSSPGRLTTALLEFQETDYRFLCQVLLRPWDERNRAFNARCEPRDTRLRAGAWRDLVLRAPDNFAVGPSVSFGGQACRLDWTAEP